MHSISTVYIRYIQPESSSSVFLCYPAVGCGPPPPPRTPPRSPPYELDAPAPLDPDGRLSIACHALALPALSAAAPQQPVASHDRTPAAVYRSACQGCHGPDGRGMPQSTTALPLPVPDFSDCNFATREPDGDWLAIIHEGGPTRGLDPLCRRSVKPCPRRRSNSRWPTSARSARTGETGRAAT